MIDYSSFSEFSIPGIITILTIGISIIIATFFFSRGKEGKKNAKIDNDYLDNIDSPDDLESKRKSDSDERSGKTRDNVRNKFRGIIDNHNRNADDT
jgi:hypothetical protein